eukprot:TRINITY_DN15638_c0_g1_i1.p1 TRINITY_DN15638_c0_g1~~TRINITY_DN15638_c0_g1_i1.p1  ORF type:complete len:371 (+),score=40.10 TRINITY_DN15638_c0_g1_i1:71-1183(+)
MPQLMSLHATGDLVTALWLDTRSRLFIVYSMIFITLIGFSCYVEEWIFKALPGFEFPWIVALLELSVFALWGIVYQSYTEGIRNVFVRKAPVSSYLSFAVCLALSQSLGKVTFMYMNYATGTIVKSVKLVPTLALSALWLRRNVNGTEWCAAGLLVASSAFMALGEQVADVNFRPVGLIVAMLQLLGAAVQGNIQERILKDYDTSISEAMLYGNGIGVLIVFVITVCNGEMTPAVKYLSDSLHALALLVIRSISFLLGALALNVITKSYGTGAATAVGTARKSLTLISSFILFPKPFHINYVFGVMAFVGADILYFFMSGENATRRLERHITTTTRMKADVHAEECAHFNTNSFEQADAVGRKTVELEKV